MPVHAMQRNEMNRNCKHDRQSARKFYLVAFRQVLQSVKWKYSFKKKNLTNMYYSTYILHLVQIQIY